MTLESIVDTYGYLAVLLGTFLEGETILVLGGFAAHRGYLALPWVIVAAFFIAIMLVIVGVYILSAEILKRSFYRKVMFCHGSCASFR